MSTYVVGDIQGCYKELIQLLDLVNFNPHQDKLWCVGDLVNRGPDSLMVLRFFKQLGERAIVVLGNHDLHLLAVAQGHTEYLDGTDTIEPVLNAPDCAELLDWLRHCPFLHHDADLGFTMIHAGLPPQWDLTLAQHCAHEVETALRGDNYQIYLDNLYGDKPKKWDENLTDWKKLRFITNCFTRLRYCSASGKLNLKKKGTPHLRPDIEGDMPWFLVPNRASYSLKIIFGHWSTLGYYQGHNVYALDSGCLWGSALTALRLEDMKVFNVPCSGERVPTGR